MASITSEQRNGLIGTVVVHAILLLLFLLFGLKSMIPPPDYGMVLNFGTTDEGMGEVQPEQAATTPVEEPEPEPEPTETSSAQPVEEQVMTQETEETVKVEPTPEEIAAEKQRQEEAEIKRKEEEARKKAQELAAKAFSSKTGGNEGKTGKPGDQGSPDGSPDPGAYSGVPGTGGASIGLGGSGRTWNKVEPDHPLNEYGKVEVIVHVDSKGNVTLANIYTSTNSKLNMAALKAARRWKFSELSELGNAKQKIIIPFVFTH